MWKLCRAALNELKRCIPLFNVVRELPPGRRAALIGRYLFSIVADCQKYVGFLTLSREPRLSFHSIFLFSDEAFFFFHYFVVTYPT